MATKGTAKMNVRAEVVNDDDSSLSGYSDDGNEKFHCAAHHLCIYHRSGVKKSNRISEKEEIPFCDNCECYAHNECTVDKVYTKKRKKIRNDPTQPEGKMCLYCKMHEDGERTPFKPDKDHENKKIPNDEKVMQLTVAKP